MIENFWFFATWAIGYSILIILGIQVIYLFIFSIAGLFYKERELKEITPVSSFVIYIPSYKEDAVILDTAKQALTIDYPKESYHIVVIADSLKKETIEKLRKMPIEVVEVVFDKSTKAKALNKALDANTRDFDYAIVFDADNVADKNYLSEMNRAFANGAKVVQGQRTAKNKNNDLAILDGISEGINNHIFRKGHRVVGLSSAIIGSAMGLEFDLYKKVMRQLTAVGGFDKEMELFLLKNNITVEYAEKAIVYDEKVQKSDVLESQRKRWLSAQLTYLKKHLVSGVQELFSKGNIDYFDKVFQMALLPRVIIIGILPISFIISFFQGGGPEPYIWLIVLTVGYISIILSIPNEFVNRRLFKALLKLPMSILRIFKLLFKLKGANKTFIHTPHGEITDDKNEK